MSSRQIATSTSWQLGSQVIMALLSVITMKCVVIGLSMELVGTYNSAYGYLQFFGILADAGLYAVAVKELSRAENKEKVLSALFTLRLFTVTVSVGGALLAAWVIPAWYGTELPLAITIAALVPAFTLFAGVLRTVFQVHYKLGYVFAAEVTQRIITTGIIVGFVFMGLRTTTDAWYLHVFLLTGGVGAAVLFFLSLLWSRRFMRVHLSWDRSLIKNLARHAFPFGLAFLCTALYRQSDITIIALLRDDFTIQNAFYGPVQRIMDMAYLLPTFLLNSTLPLLSERDSKGEDTSNLLGKTVYFLLVLGITASAFSILWARPIMELLTADTYLSTPDHPGADTVLRILGISMLGNGFVTYSFYVLLARSAWKPLVARLGFGVLLSIGLNVVLVPRFGFIGAAVTSAIVHTFLVLITMPASLQTMRCAFPTRSLWRVVVFGILLVVTLYCSLPLATSSLRTIVVLPIMLAITAILGWGLGLHRGTSV